MPRVLERLEKVRDFRKQSNRGSTLAIADNPTTYNVNVIPNRPFLAIPEVSSEQRDYMPIAYFEPPTIPSNLVRIQSDAQLWHFAVLTSRMHMAWLREIGGRLESRFRYSIGIVYNNFPWPVVSAANVQRLNVLAQAVLDARAAHPTATLGDLYDRLAMPANLRTAHARLDSAVEKLYRAAPFPSDVERVEHLLALYEGLSAPLVASLSRRARARRN